MDRILNAHSIILYVFIILSIAIKTFAQLRSPSEFGGKIPDSTQVNRSFYSHESMPFVSVIKFYQEHISPSRGFVCPMYPSCSNYSYDAISEYGFFGIVMTADRLLRCGRDLHNYRIIRKDRFNRYYDPIITSNR